MAKVNRMQKADEQVAAQLQALEQMEYPRLRAEWSTCFGTEAPRVTRNLLMLGIGWKIQERAYGGLSPVAKRQLLGTENGTGRRVPTIRLRPGAKLVREWRGESHIVVVLEKGFEWRGTRWRSLSAIAREISGGHWSGPRFFVLTGKRSLEPDGDDSDARPADE